MATAVKKNGDFEKGSGNNSKKDPKPSSPMKEKDMSGKGKDKVSKSSEKDKSESYQAQIEREKQFKLEQDKRKREYEQLHSEGKVPCEAYDAGTCSQQSHHDRYLHSCKFCWFVRHQHVPFHVEKHCKTKEKARQSSGKFNNKD